MAGAGAKVRACPEALVNLFHRRWCVPVIAEVHGAAESRDSTGARFIGLMHRLSVGRSVLRDTVEFATAHGWMRRNPGYGHPLRPELVLTVRGARIGPACASLWGLLRRRCLEEIGLRKWTLPAVSAVGEGGGRFVEIRAALPGITDRALAAALRSATGAGLLSRRVLDGTPPGVVYNLTRPGREARGAVEGIIASL
ncbi:MAG TPA: winged helix-turn-helix transcriptional regulator [Phycisphaerales bacterium]|nr:winged helix-turn-helix transcriptional regulator [Phycisphaerales bacterium]